MIRSYSKLSGETFWDLMKTELFAALDSYENQEIPVGFLDTILCSYDKVEGCFITNEKDSKDFITANWELSGEIIEYYKNGTLSDTLMGKYNPFKDPCGFTYAMEEYAFTKLLKDIPFVRVYSPVKVKLTREKIDIIKKQVENLHRDKFLMAAQAENCEFKNNEKSR